MALTWLTDDPQMITASPASSDTAGKNVQHGEGSGKTAHLAQAPQRMKAIAQVATIIRRIKYYCTTVVWLSKKWHTRVDDGGLFRERRARSFHRRSIVTGDDAGAGAVAAGAYAVLPFARLKRHAAACSFPERK